MNSQTSEAPTQTAMQAQVDDTTDITDIYIYNIHNDYMSFFPCKYWIMKLINLHVTLQ